jgi:DNA-binding SARP family transcriptional activator
MVAASPEPKAEAAVQRCPNCGSPTDSTTACVECGYLPSASDAAALWEEQRWQVVVRPDREYYEMLDPGGMDFPEVPYARRIPLTGDLVAVGRRSVKREIFPEIDLSGPLEDTGVSHRHAVLMRQPEGTWALTDQDSTNGTFLNDDEEPIPANQPVPLSDGDRIHLGGWTTLTMERLDPEEVARFEAESRPSKDTRNVARGRRLMEIALLGPLRLAVRGEDVPLTAPKLRAVLALLALRVGSPVSVLDLEWALWADAEPETARKALQNYIKDLRKLLPDDSIETTPQGYRLLGSKDCIDVFRFERRCARGRTLLQSGHPGAAVAELTRALELWRGEPLLDLADGPVGATEVVGFRERRAGAEEDLFEGRLLLGDHDSLVADLLPAVDAEPMRQRRWAQLMLALHRSGRQGEALSAFQRLRSVLGEGHGLEPSAELVELDRAIVVDRPDLQWTPPSETGTAPPTVVA